MSKKFDFLTDKFYSNSLETLDAFNEVIKQKIDHSKDFYGDKTFLHFSVKDTKENRELFKHLISDFDKYKEYQEEKYITVSSDELEFTALQIIHSEYFGDDNEIMFDKESEMLDHIYGSFILKGMLIYS